ncbi:MAG TPA: 50S ribosomal protein L14 [Candidatus Paceibacterota bacterium]|nr:50S ribosomal protein L14 [Candidatus Paceibacterota bacterium]
MIQPRTILKVIDNSGAKTVRCFRVLGGSYRKYARIGNIIVASVRAAEPRRAIKKGDVVKAVVVWQKQPYRRKDGSYIRFDENAVVLINEKKEPIGNRLLGVLPREIKEKGYDKLVALASDFV